MWWIDGGFCCCFFCLLGELIGDYVIVGFCFDGVVIVCYQYDILFVVVFGVCYWGGLFICGQVCFLQLFVGCQIVGVEIVIDCGSEEGDVILCDDRFVDVGYVEFEGQGKWCYVIYCVVFVFVGNLVGFEICVGDIVLWWCLVGYLKWFEERFEDDCIRCVFVVVQILFVVFDLFFWWNFGVWNKL